MRINDVFFFYWSFSEFSGISLSPCDMMNRLNSMQVVSLDDGTSLVSQLVVDVMGNASPIVRQVNVNNLPWILAASFSLFWQDFHNLNSGLQLKYGPCLLWDCITSQNVVGTWNLNAAGWGTDGKQIRWGEHPDGVCLVVGTCARGFVNNTASDLIYTHTPVTKVGASKTQYFWEVFFSSMIAIAISLEIEVNCCWSSWHPSIPC